VEERAEERGSCGASEGGDHRRGDLEGLVAWLVGPWPAYGGHRVATRRRCPAVGRPPTKELKWLIIFMPLYMFCWQFIMVANYHQHVAKMTVSSSMDTLYLESMSTSFLVLQSTKISPQTRSWTILVKFYGPRRWRTVASTINSRSRWMFHP
jgi:hypothetical protein